MNRRRYLSAATSGVTVCLAGCTGFLDDDIRLLGVALGNMQGEERTLSVRITRGDEAVEESTHELAPDETVEESTHGFVSNETWTFLDCTWPREPGQFTVAARLAGEEEWVERDLTEADGECVAVTIKISPFDRVGFTITETCDLPAETERC